MILLTSTNKSTPSNYLSLRLVSFSMLSTSHGCPNPAEVKIARDKREAHYPTPEEPKTCVVCRRLTATIACMQCPNKVCQACLARECLEKEESFLYFHHQHCLRYDV